MVLQVMDVDHDVVCTEGLQLIHPVAEQGSVHDREQGFGSLFRQRSQPCAETGGENHGFHFAAAS
jgi:hypothetical protein